MVTVKNINGSSDSHPKGANTWEEFWTQRTGYRFTTCSNSDCNRDAEVGAHVIKVNSSDNHWYIVPLCRACNNLTTPFTVPANRMVREHD